MLTQHVELRVVDGTTQAAVEKPEFAERGTALSAACSVVGDAGACPAWKLGLVGKHEIAVSASGFTTTTVTVDTGLSEDTCGTGPANFVSQTVALARK